MTLFLEDGMKLITNIIFFIMGTCSSAIYGIMCWHMGGSLCEALSKLPARFWVTCD